MIYLFLIEFLLAFSSPQVEVHRQVENSSVVIVAEPKMAVWVVDSDSRNAENKKPMGGDRTKYIVGRIFPVAIKELLKGPATLKPGMVISIYVPGNSEHGIVLSRNYTYLLFLNGFSHSADQRSLNVYDPRHPGEEHPLGKDETYSVLQGHDQFGAIILDNKTGNLLDDVKQELKRSQAK